MLTGLFISPFNIQWITREWINDLKTRQLLWIRLYTHLPIASATMKKILEIRFNMSVVWIGFVKIAFHGLYIYYVIWYICILYKYKKTEARGPLFSCLSLESFFTTSTCCQCLVLEHDMKWDVLKKKRVWCELLMIALHLRVWVCVLHG